jgi:hypothetical protein
MKGLLVADYVNTNMAEKLCGQHVQFTDTVENAYLDIPPVYILVTGRRQPKRKEKTREDTNRAFCKCRRKAAIICRDSLPEEVLHRSQRQRLSG